MIYHVLLTPDGEDGYDAVCPTLDCAYSGRDTADAIAGIKAEIARVLAEMRAAGKDAPDDDGYRVALEMEDRLRQRADKDEPLILATHEVEVASPA